MKIIKESPLDEIDLGRDGKITAGNLSIEDATAPKTVPEKETVEKVTLTDSEAGVLLGFNVAMNAIEEQKQAYIRDAVARRLGVHHSLTVQFNAIEKWISIRKGTLASDAPKEK